MPCEAPVPIEGAQFVVHVKALSGSPLTDVSPVPATTALLKQTIEAQIGRPAALQKLVLAGSAKILEDQEALPQESFDVLCLTDETPMWTWDFDGNPSKDQIQVEGAHLTCPDMRSDYVNVITKEPMRAGRHYFQFVMHHIGDEQWCGVIADPTQAGYRFSGRSMKAWTYYCGRMGSNYSSSIRDGNGALHAQGKAVVEFEKLNPSGDVIGMLVDLDLGAIAFDRNGKLQGACPIEKVPLWVVTHVDTNEDYVELRKPCLDDAPPDNLESLSGALLDITQGLNLR
jgi:hypothetical protein